ncbi:MAG: hypothetical protein KC486_30230 [Myxococcales bacterium]|nr:hypothetical protein [Myxococcales bacterium]
MFGAAAEGSPACPALAGAAGAETCAWAIVSASVDAAFAVISAPAEASDDAADAGAGAFVTASDSTPSLADADAPAPFATLAPL